MADVQVRFGGDASGAVAAGKETGSALAGLDTMVKSLTDAFLVMGGAAAGSFREMRTGAIDAGHSIKGVSETVKEFRLGIAELGEALIAAFAVEQMVEFFKRMGEGAEKLEHTASAFGMTTDELQRMSAVFTAAGASMDQLPTIATRLDRALGAANAGGKRQQEVFRQLGVDTSKARTQYELVNEVLAAFANQAPGVNRVQMATALFGRSIQGIAPLIGMTKEEMGQYNEQIKRFGLENRDAVVQGAALGEAFNENKNAMTGLGNVLAQSLAPGFTQMVKVFDNFIASMIESYEKGGLMKDILDTIGTLFSTVAVVCQEFGETLGEVFQAITGDGLLTKILFAALIDLIKLFGLAVVGVFGTVRILLTDVIGLCREVAMAFWTLGVVIYEALTGKWGEIENTIKTGLHNIEAEANKTAARMREQFAEMGQHAANIVSPPRAGDKGESPPGKSKGDAFGSGGGSGPSRVQVWEGQLHQMLIAENNFFGDSTSAELKFWDSKVALTKAGSKDRLEVEAKIYELRKKLALQGLAEEMSELDFKKQMARDDYATQLALEDQKLAILKKDYGEDSREYKNALREKVRLQQEAQDHMIRLEEERIQKMKTIADGAATADLQITQIRLNARRQALAEDVAAGRISATQQTQALVEMLQEQQAAEAASADAIYQIQLKALRDQLALDGLRPDERQKILDQIDQLEADHANKVRVQAEKNNAEILKAQDDVIDAMRDKWETGLAPIGQAFDSVFQAIWTKQGDLRDKILAAADQVVFAWAQMGEKWLVKWAAQKAAEVTLHTGAEVAKTTATAAGEASRTGIVAAGATAQNSIGLMTVARHIAHELAKTASTIAGVAVRLAANALAAAKSVALSAASTIVQIAHAAALAAARAYAAIAAIPVIGPFLAPAMAIGALVAVLAIGAKVASAAGGQDRVPEDGQITELHRDEMVMSAQYARPLRALLTGMDFGNTQGSLAGGQIAAQAAARDTVGGDTNLHMHYMPGASISAGMDKFTDMLEEHSDHMLRWIHNKARNGQLKLGGG